MYRQKSIITNKQKREREREMRKKTNDPVT